MGGCWTALGIHTSRPSPCRRSVDNSIGREPSWATTTCTSGLPESTRPDEGKPARTAGAWRRGAQAARQHLLTPSWRGPRMPPAPRPRDDPAANVTMSLVADRQLGGCLGHASVWQRPVIRPVRTLWTACGLPSMTPSVAPPCRYRIGRSWAVPGSITSTMPKLPQLRTCDAFWSTRPGWCAQPKRSARAGRRPPRCRRPDGKTRSAARNTPTAP